MLRTRPRPGILFRTETPAVVALPRMDVAGFVVFARRGPLHLPVALEDYPQFEDVFGGIYPLAWDNETATVQTACLAPAVKDFFAQGGRRCWVVRVAGRQAVPNRFPLTGLLQTDLAGYRGVTAAARSPGSWSDGLRVSAGLLLDPLTFRGASIAVRPGAPFTLELVPRQGQPLRAGDTLQLDCTDGIHRAYVILHAEDLQTGSLLQATADPLRTHWFRRVDPIAHPGIEGTVRTFDPAVEAVAAGRLDVPARAIETTLPAQAGDWLRLDGAAGRVWLLAGEARADLLPITAAWFEGADPAAPVLTVARLQRVQLALSVRDEANSYARLSNLACAAPHPRFLGYLPDDATLFEPHFGQASTEPNNPAALLWEEVGHPRFPLSLDWDGITPFIPLGLEAGPTWRGAGDHSQAPLVRDGLVPEVSDNYTLTGADWASFMVDAHLDDTLRSVGQRALLSEANNLLNLQGQTLSGLHALLPVDEISMAALPDAAQRGWFLTQRKTEPPPAEPEPETPPDPCARVTPFAPKPAGPEAENSDADISPKSLPEIPLHEEWQLLPPAAYDPAGLLAVQAAAAKLAAARADMVVILGLPKQYRTPESLQYRQQLAAALRLAGETTASYVALYHPWVVSRAENGALLHTPPGGAVCGVMAARSLARGAWIAPANQVIRGALAMTPRLPAGDEESFYSLGINPIRPAASGFTIWGAYTQSTDPDLEELSVRRLLILLRRIALREGQSYVFAPHSPAFRRQVKQRFEQVLARLFAQGAFAGLDPDQAYRVVIDETVNTRATIEQGQLVVELRVAPARPLTFIIVRLVQTESSLLAVQEVTGHGG